MEQLGFWAIIKKILFTYRAYDFKGISTKKELWYFVLFQIVVLIFFGIFFALNEVALGEQKGIVAIFIYTVICFFMIIQNVALIVRRLHDIGLSAWWIFLFLILTLPIAYPVIFLMFFMILLSGLSKHDLLILLLAIYIESLVTVMIVGLQEGKLINNQYRQEEINTQ